jgi:hypothetical protein
MGSCDRRPDALAIQCLEGFQGLADRPGPIIHSRDEVAVEIGDGETAGRGIGHEASLRQPSRQPQRLVGPTAPIGVVSCCHQARPFSPEIP